MAKSILPGVPHVPKSAVLPTAPKIRQNMLNVRVAPIKRMLAATKPVKPEKFGFTQ